MDWIFKNFDIGWFFVGAAYMVLHSEYKKLTHPNTGSDD